LVTSKALQNRSSGGHKTNDKGQFVEHGLFYNFQSVGLEKESLKYVFPFLSDIVSTI